MTVMLKPELLFDGVVLRVRWMDSIKIYQVVSINKTGRIIERHDSCLKSHTDQASLTNFIKTNSMRYEEEPDLTQDDTLGLDVSRRIWCKHWCRGRWSHVEAWG
jgi:hypothetical protein